MTFLVASLKEQLQKCEEVSFFDNNLYLHLIVQIIKKNNSLTQ